jgi:hypothetical protein
LGWVHKGNKTRSCGWFGVGETEEGSWAKSRRVGIGWNSSFGISNYDSITGKRNGERFKYEGWELIQTLKQGVLGGLR